VENPDTSTETPLRKGFLGSFVRWFLIGVALLWSLAVLILGATRWIDPPTTAVQMERRFQSWIHGTPYHKRYDFVPLTQISHDFQHAVISAEDARFYQHHGFDWQAIQKAAEDDMEGGRLRGGSTITQQVVKNLFLWPGRSYVRKALEFPLALWVDLVLQKRRILEIYLNVAEWGPNGEFGIEAGSRRALGKAARDLDRYQAALMAAVLPSPARRDARAPGPGLRRLAGHYVARSVRSPGAANCLHRP